MTAGRQVHTSDEWTLVGERQHAAVVDDLTTFFLALGSGVPQAERLNSGSRCTRAVASRHMPSRNVEPLLRVSSFVVQIADQEVGFAEVGRLSSETDLEGAPNGPEHRFATVVLRRALTRSTELYEWRRTIAAGKDDRRDVTIRQLSAPGGTIVNAWLLVRAWPVRWSGPAFDALSNDIACEELELMFDDLVWLDRKPKRGK
jgi:phage tail-like protein